MIEDIMFNYSHYRNTIYSKFTYRENVHRIVNYHTLWKHITNHVSVVQNYHKPAIFSSSIAAQIPIVFPYGIESVNGSDINMGCTSPLVDSDGVMVCMSQSYLVDGCSQAIDTSTSDWASQLVTVRKTQTDELTFDHVLLTFGFDTAVTLTGIELDLFLCPDMNIDAPYITVFADEESNLVFTYDAVNNSLPFQSDSPSQSSCDSLSSVNITLEHGGLADSSYITWHIQFTSSIDWVYVGEVRFLGMDVPSPGIMYACIIIPSTNNISCVINSASN